MQQIVLREWIGPRVSLALSEHEYILANLPFEGTIKIPRDKILDDNLGIYSAAIMPQLGEAVAKHPDRLLTTRINDNPVGFDGVALFSGSHPTYDAAGTTFDNDYGLALTAENIDIVWADMASRTGEDGEPLGIDGRLLVVPPALKRVAREIAKSTNRVVTVTEAGANVAAATVDNVMAGEYDVLVVPRFAANPTRWFLFDVSRPIKPFVRQVRSNPILRAFDSGAERESFDNNEFTYGVDGDDGGSYRENVGPTLPALSSRSTP